MQADRITRAGFRLGPSGQPHRRDSWVWRFVAMQEDTSIPRQKSEIPLRVAGHALQSRATRWIFAISRAAHDNLQRHGRAIREKNQEARPIGAN